MYNLDQASCDDLSLSFSLPPTKSLSLSRRGRSQRRCRPVQGPPTRFRPLFLSRPTTLRPARRSNPLHLDLPGPRAGLRTDPPLPRQWPQCSSPVTHCGAVAPCRARGSGRGSWRGHRRGGPPPTRRPALRSRPTQLGPPKAQVSPLNPLSGSLRSARLR